MLENWNDNRKPRRLHRTRGPPSTARVMRMGSNRAPPPPVSSKWDRITLPES